MLFPVYKKRKTQEDEKRSIGLFINSPILSVEFNDKEVIFNYGKEIIIMEALGDYASCSTLRPFNRPFDHLVGKTIVSVKEIFDDSDVYQSALTEMDDRREEFEDNGMKLQINLYRIKLSNGGSFYFYLENESNGFYSGWLSIDGKSF